jgi:cobalt-zinc-cadmium efflux system protein
LNILGVLLHGVADTASSVSVILSACAVYFYQWFWADAVGGLVIAVPIGLSAVFLMHNGWQRLKNRSI